MEDFEIVNTKYGLKFLTTIIVLILKFSRSQDRYLLHLSCRFDA